jgi:hypothetical protein
MDNSSVSGLGNVGIWTMTLDFQPAEEVRELAAELEELGFGALWHGEAFGRDTVSQSWLLLFVNRAPRRRSWRRQHRNA